MILTELGLGVNSSPIILNSERGAKLGPLGATRLSCDWQLLVLGLANPEISRFKLYPLPRYLYTRLEILKCHVRSDGA
jgi:hypothetical protein